MRELTPREIVAELDKHIVGQGEATASLNVPANLPLPPGFTLYHAYVVYDANGQFHMASNAVPLRLR